MSFLCSFGVGRNPGVARATNEGRLSHDRVRLIIRKKDGKLNNESSWFPALREACREPGSRHSRLARSARLGLARRTDARPHSAGTFALGNARAAFPARSCPFAKKTVAGARGVCRPRWARRGKRRAASRRRSGTPSRARAPRAPPLGPASLCLRSRATTPCASRASRPRARPPGNAIPPSRRAARLLPRAASPARPSERRRAGTSTFPFFARPRVILSRRRAR